MRLLGRRRKTQTDYLEFNMANERESRHFVWIFVFVCKIAVLLSQNVDELTILSEYLYNSFTVKRGSFRDSKHE